MNKPIHHGYEIGRTYYRLETPTDFNPDPAIVPDQWEIVPYIFVKETARFVITEHPRTGRAIRHGKPWLAYPTPQDALLAELTRMERQWNDARKVIRRIEEERDELWLYYRKNYPQNSN